MTRSKPFPRKRIWSTPQERSRRLGSNAISIRTTNELLSPTRSPFFTLRTCSLASTLSSAPNPTGLQADWRALPDKANGHSRQPSGLRVYCHLGVSARRTLSHDCGLLERSRGSVDNCPFSVAAHTVSDASSTSVPSPADNLFAAIYCCGCRLR